MKDYKKYINALRKCAEEHKNDITPFSHVIVSDLCRDTANLLEELEQESKAKTFDILHFVADNAGLSIFEAIEKAYNMGVSEQEAVLDKARAEMFTEMQYHSGTGEEVIQAYADGLHNALRIIDKCKGESEETDG